MPTSDRMGRVKRSVEGMNSSLGKISASIGTSAAGSIFTVLIAWMSFAGKLVTKDELREAMMAGGPYSQDSRYIQESINQLKSDYRNMAEKQQSLLTDMTRIAVKLDLMLSKIDANR